MVGFWTAWYLSKINCTWEMTSKTRNFLGAVILSVMTALVYLPHYLQKPSHIFGALYQAFGRILWTIPVAVLIVTCLTGNGGKINDFLGAKIWYPLSRISYLTFLLNPLVYMSVLNAAERPFHIEYHSFVSISVEF